MLGPAWGPNLPREVAQDSAWASFVCLIKEFPQLASGNSAVRAPSPGLGPDSPQGEWLDVRNIEDNELNCYN